MLRAKSASYAVSAMIELVNASRSAAGKRAELPSTTIATRYQMPVSYTAKILSQLAKASLLRSGRGPQGGFSLARPPESITLLEILRAVGAFDKRRPSCPAG